MQDSVNKIIVIFAESVLDRELLRNSIIRGGEKVFCFENELNCIDNLETIGPDVIIVKAHTKKIIRRFVFAIQAFKLSCLILTTSGIEKIKQTWNEQIDGSPLPISDFHSIGEMLKKIDDHQLLHHNSTLPICRQEPVLVGSNSKIKYIRSILPIVVGNNSPILISGETGVGKELLVRRIFKDLGPNAVVVKVNCAELNIETIARNGFFTRLIHDQHLESLNDDRREANPILIYLDGIEKLEEKVQSKLLFMFDDSLSTVFERNAQGNRKIRLIATTNQTSFPVGDAWPVRADLYHRLNVIHLSIPPLRERKEDIPALIDYFMIYTCADLRTNLMPLSNEVQKRLVLYEWPRNLKEMESLVYRIVHTRDESFVMQDDIFPISVKQSAELLHHEMATPLMPETLEIEHFINTSQNISLKNICNVFASRMEKQLIEKALETTNWNRKKAATLLNISYKSMLNKLKIYEIV